MRRLKCIDLFSGAGGFTLGMAMAGYDIVGHVEWDKCCLETYEANKKKHGFGHSELIGKDITKITDEEILAFKKRHGHIFVIVGGPPCFKAGTLISTRRGLIPIEEVIEGDEVLTHKNRFKRVLSIMQKITSKIYKLKVSGGIETFTTAEHPFYCKERKHKGYTHDKKIYEFSEPKWIKAQDLKKREQWILITHNEDENNPKDLSLEDCWLLGRYLADGYLRNDFKQGTKRKHYEIILCIGKTKQQEFFEKTKDFHYHIGFTEERTAYKYRISNKRLTLLCKELGRGAINKEIPEWISSLPVPLIKEFLAGYVAGDGCFTRNGFSITTISKKLALGLQKVIMKAYETYAPIQFYKRPPTTIIEGRTVNQHDTYSIRFQTERYNDKYSINEGNNLWVPIRYSKNIFENTTVYNLEVEEDNSYTANNLAVHNCQSFSMAGKREIGDPRDNLFLHFVRFVNLIRPTTFILENVPGLLSKKSPDGHIMADVILSAFKMIDYNVEYALLNAANYGVPQTRRRVFFFGVKPEIKKNILFPLPLNFGDGEGETNPDKKDTIVQYRRCVQCQKYYASYTFNQKREPVCLFCDTHAKNEDKNYDEMKIQQGWIVIPKKMSVPASADKMLIVNHIESRSDFRGITHFLYCRRFNDRFNNVRWFKSTEVRTVSNDEKECEQAEIFIMNDMMWKPMKRAIDKHNGVDDDEDS